jgi:glucose-1-phosphate thymidylyltransferase
MKFVPGKVEEWMDCGNKKNVTVETNSRMLDFYIMR